MEQSINARGVETVVTDTGHYAHLTTLHVRIFHELSEAQSKELGKILQLAAHKVISDWADS